MYRYKLKEGHESRVFINTVKNDDGTIDSEVPLNSPYVTAVEAQEPSPNHVTGVAPQALQGTPAADAAPAVTQPKSTEEHIA